MENSIYHVDVDWDPEAEVWVATSEDLPGLATEAPTVEALSERLRTLIPELLESNGVLPSGQPDAIAFELTSPRSEAVELLQSWIEEGDGQEQKETGEYLIQALDEDRLSDRHLFPQELKGVTW